MNKSQASARAKKLRALIERYRYEYHVNDRSIMSEAAADSLKHELSEIEKNFPELITPDSPSQRVAGQPLPQFVSVRHKTRMLSMNDVFGDQELNSWIDRIKRLLSEDEVKKLEFFVDLKMDGFSCSLVYEDGALARAVTRGDGTTGEDVTQNIKTIDSIPLTLRSGKKYQKFLSGRTEVRGEVLMYKKDFEKLNAVRAKAGLALFKNPRNTAAGTIRQLNPALVAERPLHFHGFDLIRDKEQEVPTYNLAYAALNELGIKVNAQAKVIKSAEGILKFARDWQDKRQKLPFGTDGLAIKVNQRNLYEKLGVVGKAPRGAVAYKFPAEEATTKVKDIIISVGRTGAATPVAVLEPVDVAGSTVQHASLHNQDEIERKDIRIGDTVIIHKAGDIIPQVVRVLKDLRNGSEKPFNFEQALKAHPLDFTRPKGEAVWRAVNRDSPVLIKRGLQHFASRGALDIEGLGEKNVQLLVDQGLVKDFADIYTLTKEQLQSLERFAELSASNLIEAIQAKKNPPLPRFLYGLGIRHVGEQTAIDLAQTFHNLEKLEEVAVKQPEDLYEVEGVGEIVAHSIAEWFNDESNRKLLDKFKKLGVWPQNATKVRGKLTGSSFVITGTMESMGRDEAAEMIRKLGGTFQTSVGKDTTYLVYGSNTGEAKKAKAKKFGTTLLNESDFLKVLSKP